jgi:putative N6-adenine-specific DNA methylase
LENIALRQILCFGWVESMNKITLIATATFGLELPVKNEAKTLGFRDIKVSDGRIEFEAALEDIPRANLWFRCADRVLLKMAEFQALTFDELFEKTKSLPWEDLITREGQFPVDGKSVKSTLSSVRACQSTVKKAVVERLREKYGVDRLEETGPEFAIQVSVLKDIALLTIDTSGAGLHKRGYRQKTGLAPLRENLAAALVLLSSWKKQGILIDPMCGSGTIPIEAAMIARNIAPGLKREFAAEKWPLLDKKIWQEARMVARDAADCGSELEVFGYDIDGESIRAAKTNAKDAGVGDDIIFQEKDIKDLWIDKECGTIISNLPYGIRVAEPKELHQIYISVNKMLKKKKGWSLFLLTADEDFPKYFKRSWPDRVRKLYNGNIKTNYYQYYAAKR